MWLLLMIACGSDPEAPTPPAPPFTKEIPSPPLGLGDDLGALSDVEDEPIFVQMPILGQLVAAGPIEVRGRAQVWEGRLSVRLLAPGGAVLDEQHVSATVSAPARGDWTATLTPPEGFKGPATVEAYSSSAKDGSPENIHKVPVVLR